MRSRCDSTFASRAHETLRDLRLRHLEREQRDGRLGAHCEVRGHAEREADFPMPGRAARMTRLPGWKPDVSWSIVTEAGRDAGDVGTLLVERA